MSDVMISYSRRDGDFVRRLHETLENGGREVWVDWKDIPLSADWWEEIKAAIDGANTFVFVISPDSIGSPICNLEIDYARQHNKRLVPILYREAELEDVLDKLLDQELNDNTRAALGERDMMEVARANWNAVARHNWVVFQDHIPFEENVERLISAIETDLEHVREHTRILNKAMEWQKRAEDHAFLLRGASIAEAEAWLASGVNKNPPPTSLQAEFIKKSSDAQNQRQRRRLAIVSFLLAGAVAMAILALGLAWYANNQRVFAVEQQRLAEQNASTATVAQGEALINADLAATSAAEARLNADNASSLLWTNAAEQNLQDGRSALALSLALAAVSIDNPPPQAERVLAQVAYAPGPIARFETDTTNQTAAINTVAFHPDGHEAAVGLADSNILFFDLETEDAIGAFSIHNAPVEDIVYAPDGERMLSVSGNSLIYFDVATQDIIHRMQHGTGTITVVTSIDISPDGTKALSGALDQSVVLWDLQTGEVIHTLEGHRSQVNDVTFSPDGTQALSGGNDTRLILWDLTTGEQVNSIRTENQVEAVAFTEDGTQALTGTRLGELLLWDLASGEVAAAFGDGGTISEAQTVNDVAVYDNMVIAGADDQRVTVWSLVNQQLLYVFDAHTDGVHSVQFSPDGRTALSGSSDNTMYWWGVTNQAFIRDFDSLSMDQILTATYTPDGEAILTSGTDGALVLWDVETGSPRTPYENPFAEPISALAFNTDGSRFVAGTEGGILALWDATTGEVLRTYNGHSGIIDAVAFTSDGAAILAGDEDGGLLLWDTETAEIIHTLSGEGLEAGHSRPINHLAINADDTLALSGSEDRMVILWDLETGEAVQQFGRHGGRVVGVAFGSVGTVLAASNGDEIITWDIASGNALETLNVGVEGQSRVINTVALNPRRQLALLGRTDGLVVLMNLITRREMATFAYGPLGSGERITVLAFAPDGASAVVGNRSGRLYTVRTLRLNELIDWTNANRYQADLTCAERETYNLQPLCNEDGTLPTATPESVASN